VPPSIVTVVVVVLSGDATLLVEVDGAVDGGAGAFEETAVVAGGGEVGLPIICIKAEATLDGEGTLVLEEELLALAATVVVTVGVEAAFDKLTFIIDGSLIIGLEVGIDVAEATGWDTMGGGAITDGCGGGGGC
jgi:hypothetical protein